MGFLAPWFLAGLAVAALPLWLHLLRQFKRTPLPFSSLMFFERRVQSSTKHRRLRYLTLLSLRLLLLILLVLAFANPFVTRVLPASGKRTLTVIAVDRSFSMRAGNRMARAKGEAEGVIRSLGGRDMAQVIAFDAHVESLTSMDTNHPALTEAVDSIQPGDLTSSYGELARALRILASSKGTRLQVHLFSDMQQSSMPSNFRDLQLGPDTSLILHSAESGNVANWAVESVNTAARIFETKHTKLDATIAGWQTPSAPKKVTLLLDGRPVASQDISISANGHASVQFLGFDVPYGAHRGALEITPHDDLAADDRFQFSVEHVDPKPVLFLYAGGRGRSAFYYKAALESSGDTGLRVEPFAVEQVSNRDLTPYAFVVLNDVGELDAQATQKICNYVQAGGAALIVAGPATLRAGRLPLSSGRPSPDTQAQGIGAVDDQNPAMAGGGHFQNVQFFGATHIAFKPGAAVIAKLANGTPLLTEEKMGEGRALIFSSTLDNSTNDFPLHASYLPFVAQTARYLSGTEEAMGSAVAGSPISLRRTAADKTAADVISPDGKHPLTLKEATTALSFDLLGEGFYEIGRAGGQRRSIAVHADRRESNLQPVPAETLELWRNTGGTTFRQAEGVTPDQVQPFSFWRYLMILALVAAVAESMFGSQYLRKERGTA